MNCLCTETAEFLGKAPDCHPATANGPTGYLCRDGLRDIDWMASEYFIAGKPDPFCATNDLYGLLQEGETRVLELLPAMFNAICEGNFHVVSIDFKYADQTVGNREMRRYRRVNNAVSLPNKKLVWYTARTNLHMGCPHLQSHHQNREASHRHHRRTGSCDATPPSNK